MRPSQARPSLRVETDIGYARLAASIRLKSAINTKTGMRCTSRSLHLFRLGDGEMSVEEIAAPLNRNKAWGNPNPVNIDEIDIAHAEQCH